MADIDSITPESQILDAQGRDWAWAYVVFRPIPDFPHYVIGSNGTLWGCQKHGSGAGKVGRWRQLLLNTKPRRYQDVCLCNGKRRRRAYVHALVLEAFIGPRPPGMEVCHFPDRDTSNNSLRNLRWDTHLSNAGDIRIHERLPLGGKHYKAKLTEEAVAEIRASGVRRRDYYVFAEKYGVSPVAISNVIRRKTWKHVD